MRHFLGLRSSFFGQNGSAVPTNKTVRLWDAETGDCMKTMVGHTDPVNCAEFSFDGRLVVSASGNTLDFDGSKDNTVRVWDALGLKS